VGFFYFLNLPSIRELDLIARDIASIEPNPVDWAGWVIYLLEGLEEEAQKRGIRSDYEEMLKSLKKHIGN
jgi:hypothetical protein